MEKEIKNILTRHGKEVTDDDENKYCIIHEDDYDEVIEDLVGFLDRKSPKPEDIVSILILWEQYKKSNMWESEAVDVEKVLMEQFSKSISPDKHYFKGIQLFTKKRNS